MHRLLGGGFILHPQSDQHGLDSTVRFGPFLDTVSRNEVRVTGWYKKGAISNYGNKWQQKVVFLWKMTRSFDHFSRHINSLHFDLYWKEWT